VLILAATPIGNSEDASPRLRRTLQQADRVFAEDTRKARKLFARLDIDRPVHSFHDHSGQAELDKIAALLQEGSTLVYISDAGMPGINDPGYELVRLARAHDIEVDVIPGPCAAVNALVLSGLPTHAYCFLGFFPTTPQKRAQMLERLRRLDMTAVFFEGVSRILASLDWLAEQIPNTEIAVCREMTKLHQQVLRGAPAQVRAGLEMVKGEFVLVIAPIREAPIETDMATRYEKLLAEGETPARAIKAMARELRLPKREIYARIHNDGENASS